MGHSRLQPNYSLGSGYDSYRGQIDYDIFKDLFSIIYEYLISKKEYFSNRNFIVKMINFVNTLYNTFI